MDNAPGWLPDPEREDQERYWSGSGWTDRVRPAGKGRSLHLPEHVPDLQRALAAATADIDAVEDRLSNLFDRAEGAPRPGRPPQPVRPPEPDADEADDEEIIDLYDEDEEDDVAVVDEDPIHEEFSGATDRGAEAADGAGAEEDDSFAELDAALAAEEPEKSKRGVFRRRS